MLNAHPHPRTKSGNGNTLAFLGTGSPEQGTAFRGKDLIDQLYLVLYPEYCLARCRKARILTEELYKQTLAQYRHTSVNRVLRVGTGKSVGSFLLKLRAAPDARKTVGEARHMEMAAGQRATCQKKSVKRWKISIAAYRGDGGKSHQLRSRSTNPR